MYWARASLTTFGLAALGTLLWAKAIPCGFALVTRHPCPGCGSTRAVLALAHGDLRAVVANNPFGPVMAVILAVLVVQSITSVLREGDFRRVASGRAGMILTRVVMVTAGFEILLWLARFCGAFGGPVPV